MRFNYFKIVVAFTFLMAISLAFCTATKAENFPHRTGDQTQRLKTAINQNTDGVLVFDANKVYTFLNTVNINKKIKLKGGTGTVLKLNSASKVGALFMCFKAEIAFESLVLNGASKVVRAVVDINDQNKVNFFKVSIRNSGEDGIGAYNGAACHGLIVDKCTFTNIRHMAIKIINRDTDKYRATGANRAQFNNGEITRLLAPIKVTNSTFNEGIEKVIEADCGNDDFVINNTNDPRWVSEDRDGGRRYTYMTDLAGSVVSGNTIKKYSHWAFGLIQAGNIAFRNNIVEGANSDAVSNNSVFHLEQVVKNVEISGNTMSLNSGLGNPIFISVSAKEGRQRLRENPMIIAVKGRGGFTGNSGGNTVRGSDNCPTGANALTCKKTLHSYGPRNIYIFDNTFKTTATVKCVINLYDGENIKIGVDKNGNTRKNSYAGVPRDKVRSTRIVIAKGQSGNCNVVIKEPELTESNAKDFDVKKGAHMNNMASCIKINGANAVRKSAHIMAQASDETLALQVYPNPVSTTLFITANTEKNYKITLYNMAGIPVQIYVGSGDGSFDISELAAGGYLVDRNVDGVSNRKKERIIVQK